MAIRPAAVAGTFYPGDAAALSRSVARHLSHVRPEAPRARPPKLLVLPHAGYVYSGDCAAHGIALLAPWRKRITRVVLLAPAHRVPLRGLALPSASEFETPLGRVPIDAAAIDALDDLPQVMHSGAAHAHEHAIEVQLPFLQAVLGHGFTLVPLVVGQATRDEVGAVVRRLWGGDETLVIVSSDLSHYLSESDAQQRDHSTVERILQFDGELEGDEACGAAALNGALQVAREEGLAPRLLAQCTSADSAEGDARRVVGYASIAFEPESPEDDPATLGPALIAAARAAIAGELGLQAARHRDPPDFGQPGATFVTLRSTDGRLRGCVGRLEATRPLGTDVRQNAIAAAFHDGRFAPLTREEWPGLQVEVSLLGPAVEIPARDEAQALAALRPGIDGVILDWRETRATFLPQVWEELREPEAFLRALRHKAGLPPDFWAADLRLSRYSVEKFEEDER
ncbi:AmmeMemoRadiSam system protein B [Aquabacterium humicola]|uniref:AmmeMemoRadiSam system protein B n=1 Tax=Aquabacterium humicola TaxID=3237377 RepID=UPI0025428CA6|nr:AmmeMemoRadiSam system protein B [Rubrivivax pictus]